MKRRRGVVLWLGVALGLNAGWEGNKKPAGIGQEFRQYTIRTTSRLVLLDVSVKDSSGGLVSGLGKQDFEVRENGKPQSITQFAHADIPVTVGLVVDESGSMRHKQTEVIAAAIAFIDASNPQDEIFVVNFNERPSRGLPEAQLFSDDLQQLRAALWRGAPEGRTALYDAIEMALHHLESGRRDKKTLIVVSDGGDNVSTHTLDQVMQDVLKTAATIYTIGIFDADDPDKNPGVLKRISQVSGGDAYFPETLHEIGSICRDIAKDIRTRYTVGYVPADENRASERHIQVTAASASGRKLKVRTRTKYLFTPDSEDSGAK